MGLSSTTSQQVGLVSGEVLRRSSSEGPSRETRAKHECSIPTQYTTCNKGRRGPPLEMGKIFRWYYVFGIEGERSACRGEVR